MGFVGRIPRAIAGGAAVLAACAACAGGGQAAAAPGADPTQQSIAEYDIARDLWLRRNQPRKALDHALKAIDLDEDNTEAAHLIALIYLDFCRVSPPECRLDAAEQYARQALDGNKEFREAQNTLGVILIHAKKYAEAITVLRPLSEDILYQTPENAWGNLGWAYLERGQTDLAIDALRRSVAAQPQFCVGHYRLGLAFSRKQDASAAVQAFTRAIGEDDSRCAGLQDAYKARAEALVKLGKTDPARDDLERCVQLDKTTNAGRQCSALLAKLK